MVANNTFISVQATEQIVDAINCALEIESEADPDARVQFILQRLQQLLNRDSRCTLWLLEDLTRQPSPRITRRVVQRPPAESTPIASLVEAQRALEHAAPVSDAMVEAVLDHIRTPVTRILSEAGGEPWFRTMVQRYLGPIGAADSVASMWAASPDRAVFLICHRRPSDRPFTENDVTLISLMLRAVAPIVDRDFSQRAVSVEPVGDLSERQREILLRLLAGESEKEIAAGIHRSIHTVHTLIQKIYRHFEVSSRGELMALFVDRAVVASIKHELPS